MSAEDRWFSSVTAKDIQDELAKMRKPSGQDIVYYCDCGTSLRISSLDTEENKAIVQHIKKFHAAKGHKSTDAREANEIRYYERRSGKNSRGVS